MYDKINGDVPAPPVPDGETMRLGYHGLTKREWFAGMALIGLLSNPSTDRSMSARSSDPAKQIASACFSAADAMIKVGNNDHS